MRTLDTFHVVPYTESYSEPIWQEWHKPYEDPTSDLSRERQVVQSTGFPVAKTLDDFYPSLSSTLNPASTTCGLWM